MVTAYGRFHNFCRDTGSLNPTLPICYLFNEATTRGGDGFGGCNLTGIHLSGNDRHLANLGSILLDAVAILLTFYLLWRTERKPAAVGRREMQLFLSGYLIISICEIFTVGGFPLESRARRVFVAIHIASITATSWILLMNSFVALQYVDDGTFASIGLVLTSAAALFIGTGYIALDTGFSWTGYWDSSLTNPNRSYSLYTMYLLVPLIFIVVFFLVMIFIIFKILGERTLIRGPFKWLVGAGLCFAIGQIFQYVVSVHICNGVNGHINGGFFQVLFNILAVYLVWRAWDNMTEDEWPLAAGSNEILTSDVHKDKSKEYS